MGQKINGVWIRDQQVKWLESREHRSFNAYLGDKFQRKLNRLQSKYLEPILNFRYLVSKSKREGLSYLTRHQIDIFEQFNELIDFKMVEEREELLRLEKIEDGEPDYEGDWEVNRQNNFIMNSRHEAGDGDESNRYRFMIKQLKEEHERAEQEKAEQEAGN